jgi:hypothetical protein
MSVTAAGSRAVQLQTIERRKPMPSTSKAQQALMAIAEHEPEKLKKKNRGILRMTHKQLDEFASTPTKKLPEHVRAGKRIIKGSK